QNALTVNHDYLLSKIHCPSRLKRDVKQWLKAGVLDNGVFEDTERGTPQGGVISPLLANIALDGMARLIENCIQKKKGRKQATLIRYADDFVVQNSLSKPPKKRPETMAQSRCTG
ncbi:hypothetical protein B9T07_25390, partial [Limnospira fusiformis CCALA 023]